MLRDACTGKCEHMLGSCESDLHSCDNRPSILPLRELGASLINHSAESPADVVSLDSISDKNLLCVIGEAVSSLQQGCDVCRLKAVLMQGRLAIRLKLFPVVKLCPVF